MTPTRPSFAAFREPAGRAVFELVFGRWRRVIRAPHRLWVAAVNLPDRDATPDDVPAEFFRFPPF